MDATAVDISAICTMIRARFILGVEVYLQTPIGAGTRLTGNWRMNCYDEDGSFKLTDVMVPT